MNNRKKIFIILCVVTIAFVAFMLLPDGEQAKVIQNEDNQNPPASVIEKSDEEITSDTSFSEKTDEWNSTEFEEDKETEILGTFARKEGNKTVFIYFDRDGVLLREIHEASDVKKELGRYRLSGSVLTMDDTDYDFARKGDDIIIDGKTWEYLDDVILSII